MKHPETPAEWAQAVCDEGARVQADHQKLINVLRTRDTYLTTENARLAAENERLRALLEQAKDYLEVIIYEAQKHGTPTVMAPPPYLLHSSIKSALAGQEEGK